MRSWKDLGLGWAFGADMDVPGFGATSHLALPGRVRNRADAYHQPFFLPGLL